MRFFALVLVFFVTSAFSFSPDAKEFIEISKKLEPVQCEKRQLRRGLILAKAEGRDEDSKKIEQRFSELNRNPETAKLEKRLGELERRISDGKGGVHDPEDLQAINFQRREAFYRCD